MYEPDRQVSLKLLPTASLMDTILMYPHQHIESFIDITKVTGLVSFFLPKNQRDQTRYRFLYNKLDGFGIFRSQGFEMLILKSCSFKICEIRTVIAESR